MLEYRGIRATACAAIGHDDLDMYRPRSSRTLQDPGPVRSKGLLQPFARRFRVIEVPVGPFVTPHAAASLTYAQDEWNFARD